MFRSYIKKVVLLSLFFLFISDSSQAYLKDVDLTNERSERQRIRKQQKEDEYGYRYDSYEEAKQEIFTQLEVITGDEETRYIIVPGDTLTISYTDRNERVGAVYRVSSEGEIFLPLVGPVKIANLNRRQSRALLEEMLSEYIRHPDVNITVNTAGRIMIVGEVNRPGLYLMQPNLTVMEAILTADSYNEDTANLKSVILMRGGLKEPIVMRLNLHKMITKGDRSDDVMIKPGDMIYVPKTFISNLIKFKDEVYKWVSTYYGFGRLPAPPKEEENQPILWK